MSKLRSLLAKRSYYQIKNLNFDKDIGDTFYRKYKHIYIQVHKRHYKTHGFICVSFELVVILAVSF